MTELELHTRRPGSYGQFSRNGLPNVGTAWLCYKSVPPYCDQHKDSYHNHVGQFGWLLVESLLQLPFERSRLETRRYGAATVVSLAIKRQAKPNDEYLIQILQNIRF